MYRGGSARERRSVDRHGEADRFSGQSAPELIYPGRMNDLLIYSFFLRRGREYLETPAESADDGMSSHRQPVTRFITGDSAVLPAPEGTEREEETGSDDLFIRVPVQKEGNVAA